MEKLTSNKVKGFSSIELITILILLGILMASGFSRLDVNAFRQVAFEQELRSALRFAQKLSMSSGCDVQVSIVAATNSYALFFRNDAVATPGACIGATGAFATPVSNPSGNGNFAAVAPSGVNVSTDLSFFYNLEGRPSIAGGTVTVDGQVITVENITGFVY